MYIFKYPPFFLSFCIILTQIDRQIVGLELDSKYAKVTLDMLEEKYEDPSMYEIININLKHWKPPT